MSKAEELAKKLGDEIVRTVAHDVLMQDTLTHLRTLDASHQRLKEALEQQIAAFDGDTFDEIEAGYGLGTAQRIHAGRAALEQAKDLS